GNIVLGAGGVVSNGFDNTSTSFSGLISGTGALAKYGTGVLTLSSNTFSGGAAIKAGTLALNHVNALGASTATLGDATVGADATLSTLTGGTITNSIVVSGGGGAGILAAS